MLSVAIIREIIKFTKEKVGTMGTIIIVIASLIIGAVSSVYYKSGDNAISDIAEEIVQAETGVNPDAIDDAIGADFAKKAATK